MDERAHIRLVERDLAALVIQSGAIDYTIAQQTLPLNTSRQTPSYACSVVVSGNFKNPEKELNRRGCERVFALVARLRRVSFESVQ